MYRPNFCAECGERVMRARWRVWTSRRFCAPCARGLGRRRFALTAALVLTLAGAGFLLGRASRPAPTPLPIERGASPLAPAPPAGAVPGPRQSVPRYGPDGSDAERPTDPDETVSICGARTKKGTPCQRRVRGTGRCWQHRGRPAILPPAKLVVPE